jgi:recombination protein RecR
MEYPSKLIEDAVEAFASLPGIGKKSALRLVMHLLQKPEDNTVRFAEAIERMRSNIRFCSVCHNVSDNDTCNVCSNPRRDRATICVVENFRDVISIENTRFFSGLYHVLGGLISPMDGIGPDQLQVGSLLKRVQEGEVKEVLMALNPTIDGDTTIFYLSKVLKPYDVRITTIARGVAFGGELEFVDEITLARSIAARLPYESYLGQTPS